MARTTEEIYDLFVDKMSNFPVLLGFEPATDSYQQLLTDLNSTSKVARWRLLFYAVAYATQTLESLFDQFKLEVNKKVYERFPSSLEWLAEQISAFQYGDTLQVIDYKPQYSTIDESKKIIARVALEENLYNEVVIKVAKMVGGSLTPLISQEKDAVVEYILRIKPPGMAFHVLSYNGDILQVYGEVVYDPLVIAPNGSLISDPFTFPFVDAINNYLASIPFNGTFVNNKMIDDIQAVEGYVGFELNSAKYYDAPNSTYTPITRIYETFAGWIVIDTSYPLSSTLTYTAGNV